MESTLPNWWPQHPAIYDRHKTYLENAEEGPFFQGEFPERVWPDRSDWIDFLGHSIASPIGIPAGPLLNAKWIDLAGKLGFDVLTYKTIRSYEHQSHPLPNVVPVDVQEQLQPDNLPESVHPLKKVPDQIEKIGITNSFGNPSRTREYLEKDIPLAKSLLKEGQLLIVSTFGAGENMIEDFVTTSQMAVEFGAPVIEANYSCPNVSGGEGALYQSAEMVENISKRIVKGIGEVPLIIKMGLCQSKQQLRETMVAAARAGVRGICGLNTISMKVIPPISEDRPTCGICGNPIREAALEFIRDAVEINHEEKLGLVVMGTGGVMLAEHFEQFLDAGADIAMTATGMMWDPLLAMRYHESKLTQRV